MNKMSFANEISDMSMGLLGGAITLILGVALFIAVHRWRLHRRQRLSMALVPWAGRSVVRVENFQYPLETEDQKAMWMQARYIHYPPMDLGDDTMPLEYETQMDILADMQEMYRNGTLFPHHRRQQRWPLYRWNIVSQ
ncbi:uncharacterized protein LOC111071973 [Drosophila obscura]|uniref:uncharacterized protein LOC111071973 n=1 Tax=Drosophila obscura TaxID=7282 RepID=UPI000BA11155|nr:uncharacterized protein LOC111071973 [Drosophila obscura]